MMAIDAIVECFDDPEEDAELVCRPRRVCSSSGSGDDDGESSPGSDSDDSD